MNIIKSERDSWKLSYEDAINMMKEELEEAKDEYSRLSDLLLEEDLDYESYLLEDYIDNMEDYMEVLDDAIDVYERMNDVIKKLDQDREKVQRKIHL